jgi:hypothetical protein
MGPRRSKWSTNGLSVGKQCARVKRNGLTVTPMAKPSFTLDASVKDLFFDRAKILNRERAANVRRLSKIGAYVRQRGKSNLRRRKRVSRPGETPSVRSRDSFATLRNILFASDRTWESVVIGPRVVPGARLKRSNRQTVPQLLEQGGQSLVTFTKVGVSAESPTGWLPGDRRSGNLKDAPIMQKVVNYEPRPFMGPALQAEVSAGTMANVFYSM